MALTGRALRGAALAIFLVAPAANAQDADGESAAHALAANVVRITATGTTGGNGWTENGFGFIVAERESTVLVVTANHVVRGPHASMPGSRVDGVRVEYRGEGKSRPAVLLDRNDDTANDIAVLEVDRFAGLSWRRDAIGVGAPKRGVPVWFVGRDGDWYVPTKPGRVNAVTDAIAIDGLDAALRGTSGAPLISESGIVGLIVAADGPSVRATPIAVVEQFFRRWDLTWQLTAYDAAGGPDNFAYDLSGHRVRPGQLCLKEVRGDVDGGVPFALMPYSQEPLQHEGQCKAVLPGRIEVDANYPLFRCESPDGRREDSRLVVIVKPGGRSDVTCHRITKEQNDAQLEAEAKARGVEEIKAELTYSPGWGPVPLEVSFSGGAAIWGVGEASFHWDFGDGATSSKKDVTHVYTRPGKYRARLTVSAQNGKRDQEEVDIHALDPSKIDPNSHDYPDDDDPS